jgi:hypothetical protein
MALDRKWLYTKTVEKVTKAGKLIEFNKLYPSQDSWITIRFLDEKNTEITLNNSIKSIILTPNWTLKKFYKTFACDLEWAKSTQYCGGGGSTPETTITNTEILNKLKTGGEDFWNKIRTGIPSIYVSAGKYIYDKTQDLEKWWENYKKEQSGSVPSNDNTESGGIYTTKGDPYQYKIVNCVWFTKTLVQRKTLKFIPDWIPLENNQAANTELDRRFPAARKDCKKTEVAPVVTDTNKNLPLVSGGRKNPYLNFNIDTMSESKIKLNTLIKESLIESSKLKKQNLITESNIIGNRTKFLIENRTLKTETQRNKFFNEILIESNYLNSQGFSEQLINEQFWDVLKTLFGDGSEGTFQYFKEYLGKQLIDKLTPLNSDGWISGLVVKMIGNVDVADMNELTNCSYVVPTLTKSIVEEVGNKIKKSVGMTGPFYDILRNSLAEMVDHSDFGKSIERNLSTLICPLLGSVKDKISSATDKMKEKVLSK